MNTRALSHRRYGFLLLLAGMINVGSIATEAATTGAIKTGAVKTEIVKTDSGYQLLRDGQPYRVRGAGIAVEEPDTLALMQALKAHGGNSLRTWHVGDGRFLDEAHTLGLTVSLCLDIKRERHGFDYGDPAAVQAQLEQARELVLKHKDHPALLTWVIGNELNHDYSDPRVYDAVNQLSRMIHELDPNHPTTTTTAGIDQSLAAVISQRASDLDFISVQLYGALANLPMELGRIQLDKPIMVTEWGTIGHWEVPATTWGAPIELNSSAKAAFYRRGYDHILHGLGQVLIGDYAFLWGQKQERTPTWYGVFVDGHPTQAVQELQHYWTGKPAQNLAPEILALTLNNQSADESVRLSAGQRYPAQVSVRDPEQAPLNYRWQVMAESQAKQAGGDPEKVPEDHTHMLSLRATDKVWLETAGYTGAYRLFVYVTDAAGNVAHANLPFYIEADPITRNDVSHAQQATEQMTTKGVQ